MRHPLGGLRRCLSGLGAAAGGLAAAGGAAAAGAAALGAATAAPLIHLGSGRSRARAAGAQQVRQPAVQWRAAI
jgi:hypothetical protein